MEPRFQPVSNNELSQVNGGVLLLLLLYSHYNTAEFKAEPNINPDTGEVTTDDGGGKFGPTVLR